ncbi:MAG: hypothetical protein US83_C0001G0050 [Candidatus Falkowbacteria bacterium GW2011_GWC2_38_22]|uniref:Uncharacterized protein n=1 Tax=Candidatus Falkowbacteria bacterium GW2011_GWE1_38_31 TaxID=1618638 RepID=A0A0G0N1E3_9BACT|nr:MAG: hypothetical protein US73_C0004G0078 [Candidatus Falkowbacteria bacterium GW2011_GWF2_38_1205]KKQ62116.1 MAG: hypothetical protein US83_C0001G0050 [Candidatus Falkowbacteria bacterium GW2011_GWC2_38_22]KKQ64266.1 MAG: hypothetical protein US84_C0001G0050 [Candidatus Falkowbacteria bacterium GW2011_GWF1_38_22]KKQ66243.1 MAG: hypothetical protein US87_C0002G0050 [Candidatus Falkowbacteria bacterium GW2011_GWE2_38_254]KKQ70971.1 MAG: hypothetical protein US91_C0002G0050 [Candidatus Falkowb
MNETLSQTENILTLLIPFVYSAVIIVLYLIQTYIEERYNIDK